MRNSLLPLYLTSAFVIGAVLFNSALQNKAKADKKNARETWLITQTQSDANKVAYSLDSMRQTGAARVRASNPNDPQAYDSAAAAVKSEFEKNMRPDLEKKHPNIIFLYDQAAEIVEVHSTINGEEVALKTAVGGYNHQ